MEAEAAEQVRQAEIQRAEERRLKAERDAEREIEREAAERLRLERQLPPIGDSEFSCEQVGQTYQGRVSVRPTPNPLFRRIDVHMLDPEGQHLLLYTTVMSRL